ncbi:MAG TPA: SemiSWEET family transporter [Actinocatenispora sp.]
MIAFLGFFAAALSTCSLVPQVYRTVRTRSTGDLAWGYLVAMLAGGVAWLSYGIATGDVAVIAANAVCTVMSAIIVGTKARAHLRPHATLAVVPDPEPATPESVALGAEPAAFGADPVALATGWEHATRGHVTLEHMGLTHAAREHVALEHVALEHVGLTHAAGEHVGLEHVGLERVGLAPVAEPAA